MNRVKLLTEKLNGEWAHHLPTDLLPIEKQDLKFILHENTEMHATLARHLKRRGVTKEAYDLKVLRDWFEKNKERFEHVGIGKET